MTHVDWQAEHERLSVELGKIDVEWAALRARGDWDGARVAQANFYRLKDELRALDTHEPTQLADNHPGWGLTLADWSAESERIAREIASVEIEWKALRDKGEWEIAQGPQARYHVLRTQQAALAAEKPRQ